MSTVSSVSNPYAALNAGTSGKSESTAEAADRFLKLLVT